MLQNIIFDFGDVFINLNHQATQQAFTTLGFKGWTTSLVAVNQQFEKGNCSETQFLSALQEQCQPDTTLVQVKEAWNTLLGNFPEYRLHFLKHLATQYRLFLLSNTDAIHIPHFEASNPKSFVETFYNCFEKVYFSFEMHQRKPDVEIYQQVLQNHSLKPSETLFVDDKKENTDAAQTLGISVWNLPVGKQDVIDLPQIISTL